MKVSLIFFFFLSQFNLLCQVDISLNWESELYVNEAVFKHGELSLQKFKDIVGVKHTTKRLKKPEVRFYRYCFKKLGIYLESSDFEKPSDKCRSMTIIFNKKGKKKFKGAFILLGKEITMQTKFEELFYNKDFENYLNKDLNQDLESPYKGILQLRIKGCIITILFEPFGDGIRELEINSFLFDPQYKEKKI